MQRENEINLADLGKLWWERRRSICLWALCGLAVGLATAFLLPGRYTAVVRLVAGSEPAGVSSDLSGLGSLLGFNLNALQRQEYLSAELYPDIAASTPFLMELCQRAAPGPLSPRDSHAMIRRMRKSIDIFTDNKSGLTTVSVTGKEPAEAAVTADSLVVKLERYLIDTRTHKARADLVFAAERFEEAKAHYYAAQEAYARFADRNRHLVSESAAVERDRLHDEQQLAYSLYSQLAGQLELARIRVQERTPVLTIIEPAVEPVHPSAPHRRLIVLAGLLLGATVPMARIFGGWFRG